MEGDDEKGIGTGRASGEGQQVRMRTQIKDMQS